MLDAAFAGLASGGAYAVIGVCAVLMYRMVGVLNFSLAACGTFGAYLMLTFHEHGLAYGPAAILGILAGSAVSAACGFLVAQWFYEADDETRSTIAIALMIALLTIGFQAFGDVPRDMPTPLTGNVLSIGGAVVTSTALASIACAVGVAVGVTVLLARTRVGVRLRALSQRPITAELMGIHTHALSTAVWASAGAIATLSILIVAPTRPTDYLSLSMLVLPGFAAALVGLFRNLHATVLGGIGIGLAEGAASNYASIAPYRSILPFLVVIGALLWTQRAQRWDEAR